MRRQYISLTIFLYLIKLQNMREKSMVLMAMLVKQNPFRQYLFLLSSDHHKFKNNRMEKYLFWNENFKKLYSNCYTAQFFSSKVMINDAFMQIFIYIFVIWGLDFFRNINVTYIRSTALAIFFLIKKTCEGLFTIIEKICIFLLYRLLTGFPLYWW